MLEQRRYLSGGGTKPSVETAGKTFDSVDVELTVVSSNILVNIEIFKVALIWRAVRSNAVWATAGFHGKQF